MSVLSRIEWTDATWNPVRGCTFVNSMGDFFHEEIPPLVYFCAWRQRCTWRAGIHIKCSRGVASGCGRCFADDCGPLRENYISGGASQSKIVNSRGRSLFVSRAAPGGPRGTASGRHLLGNCQWRERAGIAADERGLGAVDSRAMRGGARPILLQAMGRCAQEETGRTLLGRTYDGFPSRVQNPTLPATLRSWYAKEIAGSGLVQLRTG
jgi:hypothetical protein